MKSDLCNVHSRASFDVKSTVTSTHTTNKNVFGSSLRPYIQKRNPYLYELAQQRPDADARMNQLDPSPISNETFCLWIYHFFVTLLTPSQIHTRYDVGKKPSRDTSPSSPSSPSSLSSDLSYPSANANASASANASSLRAGGTPSKKWDTWFSTRWITTIPWANARYPVCQGPTWSHNKIWHLWYCLGHHLFPFRPALPLCRQGGQMRSMWA